MTKRLSGRARAAAALALVMLVLPGCRQPDGAVPAPQGEQTNRIGDISRDLQNLANNDSNAPAELLDDLTYLESVPRPPGRLKELADALAVALRGTKLPDAEAQRIAGLVFQMVGARDLSQAQIEQIGSDLRDALTKVGAKPEDADRVSSAAAALASEVTQNKKRWYHR